MPIRNVFLEYGISERLLFFFLGRKSYTNKSPLIRPAFKLHYSIGRGHLRVTLVHIKLV